MPVDGRTLEGIKRRSQAHFNRDHTHVVEYGDEGENLVLGNQYSFEEAKALFRAFMEENSMDPDDYGVTVEDISTRSFGAGVWDEAGYRIGGDEDGTERWQGWVFNVG